MKFKGYFSKNVLNKLYLFNRNIEIMTKITHGEVKKVANLARLELNDNEISNHAEQLEKILEYINNSNQ